MAKYIELGELQKFCRDYTEVDAVGLILAGRTDLIHTADVVEREKIDKAVKVANDYISTAFKLRLNERAFGMREILEVFVRNIGENK